jgi:hypothetical protein
MSHKHTVETERRPVRMSPCFHQRVDRGLVYEVCMDCGAVRMIPRAGHQAAWDGWHSCERCVHP